MKGPRRSDGGAPPTGQGLGGGGYGAEPESLGVYTSCSPVAHDPFIAPEFSAVDWRGVARRLLILGSTGSIGTQALEIVAVAPDLELVGLSAEHSWESLVAQARTHGVGRIALADADAAARAAEAWTDGEVLAGAEGLVRLVVESGADLVLNGLVGSAGLGPTVATLGEGIDLALANKESLVVGGELVTQLAEATGAQILPVDSEHSALFQLHRGRGPRGHRGPARHHRLGRPVPRAQRRRAGRRDRGGGAQAPDLGHGRQDHHRLGDADEQGARAHRGPPPLRHAVRPHRRGRAPAVDRARPGAPVRRRLARAPGYPDMRVPIAYALHHPERVDVAGAARSTSPRWAP